MPDTPRSAPAPAPIREWHGVTPSVFQAEILPRYEPAVMRGLVADWPLVREGTPRAQAAWLASRATPAPVDTLTLPAAAKGRIGYLPDVSGFTFALDKRPLAAVIEGVLALAEANGAGNDNVGLVAQSAAIADCLPGFPDTHALPLLPPSVMPRLWLGTAVTTPAHIDESHNIACVVAGRRRFTLFPPDAVADLYLGPLDYTPTGSPISMVDIDAPDPARFPRFGEALARAQSAVLEPGDAIFIPTVWWHHVASLARFNMLVNYWWKPVAELPVGSPFDALLHAATSLQGLDPAHRAAWGALFHHFLFDPGVDPGAHIPPQRRGVLGTLTPQQAVLMKAWLARRLQK